MALRIHACLECGAPTPKRGDFCSAGCRTDFNNRRRTRGAELYDLYMAHRFERDAAKALGVFQAVNRLASNFRDEDKARRAARRSWRKPETVMSEKPYLKAMQTSISAGGRR